MAQDLVDSVVSLDKTFRRWTMDGGLAAQDGNSETVQDNLKRRRERLSTAIAEIDKALAILEGQPQLLEALNILRKVGI